MTNEERARAFGQVRRSQFGPLQKNGLLECIVATRTFLEGVDSPANSPIPPAPPCESLEHCNGRGAAAPAALLFSRLLSEHEHARVSEFKIMLDFEIMLARV